MLSLLDRLFAPLARLLIAQGVPFPDLAERFKAHYVAAAAEAAARDDKVTDSRLSVMTGLQRRDIVRLRAQDTKSERPNHLARLVALWRTDPKYASADLERNGPAPSFEALAQAVRKDVHPRTMLDTLLSAGTIGITAADKVRLLQTSYQPLAGSEDQLAYLARNLGDHLQAATENVTGHAPPHFERAVHYTNLTPEQIETLRHMHSAGQMALFEKLSHAASGMKAANKDDARHRFRAGAYFYAQDEGKLE